MNYYPIYLDITNRRCVVAGGGDVAERKVERLLECGARVIVIGKTLTPALKALKKAGRIDHIEDDYDAACLHETFLVIGATDQDEVNARISADARERGIMVNIVDDPDRCDFILPSLFQRGDLSVAISTGGKSPALAKKLREDMEEYYGQEYLILLKILGVLREKVKAKGRSSDENRKLFESLVRSNIIDMIREKNWDGVRKRIYELTGEDAEVGE